MKCHRAHLMKNTWYVCVHWQEHFSWWPEYSNTRFCVCNSFVVKYFIGMSIRQGTSLISDLQWLLLKTIVGSNLLPSKYYNQSSLKGEKYLYPLFYEKSPASFTRGICFGHGFFLSLGRGVSPSLISFLFFSRLCTSSFSQEMESAQSRLSV